MYTFAYKYGRKISYAPLFVHYTHSGASFAFCVCECPGDQRERRRTVDQMFVAREAGGRSAANEAIEHHPCQPLPYLSLQRPVSVVSFGPSCFEGSVGRYFMSIHKIHAGFWAENLITCLDNR